VLVLMASGLSNAEIAAELIIEVSTVETHVKRILMKLRLRDRVPAVIFAYEHGVAPPRWRRIVPRCARLITPLDGVLSAF
jgi:Bacterial regulatory proteins, luxR family